VAQRAGVDSSGAAEDIQVDTAQIWHKAGTPPQRAISDSKSRHDSRSISCASNGHKKPRVEGGVLVRN
jgi:hypothetical protein